MMKKGQVYEGVVERVDFPGKGVVRVGEETCIVKNCLPGQKISFSVNKVRKGKAEGRLLEVLEQSPLECGSPCSHFGLCGGCTYLSLPYEEQLKVKEGQMRRILKNVLDGQEIPCQWEGIKGSPAEFGYRNKMEFSFGDEYKDGPLALGMHRRGSFYDVVSVTDCRIVDEDYRKILGSVRTYFAEKGISYFHRLRHEGFLRHLLVRKAARTGEILVALVTTTQWPEGCMDTVHCMEKGHCGEPGYQACGLIEGFKELLLGLQLDGKIAGILHILNDSIADVVQSDETRILYGQDYFYEELLGLKFKISTFSFFQTNSLSAEVLYDTVRQYIKSACEGGDREGDVSQGQTTFRGQTADFHPGVVFDLYSGTGTIAQLMAPVAEKVIGVEIVEEAVEAAKKNAQLNGLTNCEFIAGDVLKVLDQVEEKPDLIILDPPRDGIHPKALPKIIAYGVKYIVYVSCKPTSLARDLEVFLANGYRAERAVAVDQFPWTANCEVVCLLGNRKPDTRVKISVETEELKKVKEEK